MIRLNKTQWKTYNFGEIVFNITERVEPKQTDLNIYVGLEHLDPNCLHITRKGNPSDVEGTKLRVYPGDIIFGKRRAYQRKASIVDFDGICSAHAMVVRANPQIISPELLPHFMHSDLFMDRAIKISVGSLSPTINWSTLRLEKFTLPPLKEQNCIADLLWSIDGYVEKQHLLKCELMLLLKSFVKDTFNSANESVFLEEILSKDCFITKKAKSGEIPYVEIGDINILSKDIILKDKPAVSGSKYAVFRDIIISKVRPTRGAIAMINLEKVAVSNAFTIIRSNERFNQELLFALLAYNDHFLYYLGEKSTGSTYPTVSDSDILSYKIPIIDKRNQEKLLSILLSLQQYSYLCESNINAIKKIWKQIIDQIFE